LLSYARTINRCGAEPTQSKGKQVTNVTEFREAGFSTCTLSGVTTRMDILFYVDLTASTAGAIVVQRGDPVSKHPVGVVTTVLDLQRMGRFTTFSGGPAFGPAVSPNHLIFGVTESTGSVWLAGFE